ncbi:MAG: phosphoribosylanthranilate isomerase [Puniceicoccaceae bacterium]|nr:MAG: phosphoribosylanthranilate isomerase [Puniceicoccaceae bacterium]
MAAPVAVKICGITREEDGRAAARLGASWLGFIHHPTSPRHLPRERMAELMAALKSTGPGLVAVSVRPSVKELAWFAEAGADFLQVHFPAAPAVETLRAWAQAVGPERIWLVPRIAPGESFDPAWLEYGRTVLWDTYQAGEYGGSGKTGNWEGFARLSREHSGTRWVLAGGLHPENLRSALAASGARCVDVASGVEAAPGRKDPALLEAFFAAARTGPEA